MTSCGSASCICDCHGDVVVWEPRIEYVDGGGYRRFVVTRCDKTDGEYEERFLVDITIPLEYLPLFRHSGLFL